MEFSLMIIGVNQHTAPVAVRERFWMSEGRRSEALTQLSRAEGIDEVALLTTCKRTEFLLATRDASAASGSVLNFLTHAYGLRLCEWKHFYRKLDETALAHLFRVASGLDSILAGEPEIAAEVNNAWTLAREAGATGRLLDAVLQKALSVSQTISTDTPIRAASVSVACAAVELARQIFGSLHERKVLLLGTGRMSQASGRCLHKHGARDIRVIGKELENARAFAGSLGGVAVACGERLTQLEQADIVISSESCRELALPPGEVAGIAERRQGAPLLLADLALPRSIDSKVRSIGGVFLYDVDELQKITKAEDGEYKAAVAQAEAIITREAKSFYAKLLAERMAPTIVALRGRLDEICREELQVLRQESGGGISEQEYADLQLLASRITHHIAGALARELKDLPEKVEQERLTAAVQRLFHLEQARAGAAGTRS